jgi:hypothetical protein
LPINHLGPEGVNSDDFRAFTSALVDRAVTDERVVGLVAVGSMAERDYAPDEWSDHDFFLVTQPGEQDAFRTDLSWLPRADEIVLSFRETEHGLKVVYEDAHLIEFAVFSVEELRVAPVDRHRVLLDRGGVADGLVVISREQSSAPRRDGARAFDLLLSHVLVGPGRHCRGETLSGAFFVRSLAVSDLVSLVTATLPAENETLLDGLDPLRRFELVYPEIARELDELSRADTLTAARGLLALAERELREVRPELPWHALDVVRGHLPD